MSRKCDICGKKPQIGHKLSHAHNVTRRRWLPNIQKVHILYDGRKQRMNVCTSCLSSNRVSKI